MGATCSVSDSHYNTYQKTLNGGKTETVYECGLKVNTSLTGGSTFDAMSGANADGCANWGWDCDYNVPYDCKGKCWVAYEEDDIKGVLLGVDAPGLVKATIISIKVVLI